MAARKVLLAPAQGHVTSRLYYPELDALRFFAFLAVFVSHSLTEYAQASQWSRAFGLIRDAGNFGVPVFFSLSAFLITDLLLRERAATGRIHLRNFYLRRVLRIWPLYVGILLVYAVLGRSHPAFHVESGRIAASLLMAGNWYLMLHPTLTTPLRALWSISVEEQFYVMWPVVAKFSGRRGLRYLALAVFPAAAAVILSMTPSQFYLNVTIWMNSFVDFQFFAGGALLALAMHGAAPRLDPGWRCALAAAATALFLLAAGVFHIKRPLPAHNAAALLAGYACLALASVMLLTSVFGLDRRFVPAWLAGLGRISFGLYVLHETGFLFADELTKRFAGSSANSLPLLLANKTAALLITISLAWLSYRFWERPFLRLKQRFTFIPSRPV